MVAAAPMTPAERAIMAAMVQAIPEPASGLLTIYLAAIAGARPSRKRLHIADNAVLENTVCN
jgi:hypothetical protein